MEQKTVRVEGLPTEIPLERLKDKLTIHFLRSRNSGGEIESISIVSEPPAYALVTFEEADVAQRVLQKKGHVLSVNGKTYPLRVTSHATELGPDEIFSRVSMIVDYRRFPDSIKHAMKSLREIHKGVQFSFDQTEELFTVNGKYTEIQAFNNDVLKMLGLGSKNLKEHPSLQCNIKKVDTSMVRVTQNSEEVSCPLAESKFETWNLKSKAESETQNPRSKAEKRNPRSKAKKGNPSNKPEIQNLRIVEGDGPNTMYRNPKDEQDIEQLDDFSLVMDSDIYMYIQKFHHAEFQKILCKYDVEVVDVSSDGITTLYLQAGFETANHIGALTKAHFDLLHQYQQFEASLRKEQISKTDVKCDGRTLKMVPEELQKLCPSLLCLEDDRFFYFIGNIIDVSQAKHYIQDLMPPNEMGRLVKTSELSVGPHSAARQRPSSSRGSMEYKSDISPKRTSPTKFELKAEHKLAANFSSPKVEVSLLKPTPSIDIESMRSLGIWSKEDDYQKKEETLQITQLNPIRDIEMGIFPGTGTAAGEIGQKDPQVTDRMKGDILPKTPETFPSFSMSKDNKVLHSTGARKNLGPLKPYSHDSALDALQYLSLIDTAGMSSFLDFEPSKPKITLKRSNSFSAGRPKEVNPPWQEVKFKEPSKVAKDTKILDEMCLYTWLWSYMKDASNITKLCDEGGIQIDEENTQDITILKLSANDKTKLDSVKQSLQSLYHRLSTDLTYQSFSYSEIGVEGPHDEVLNEWCCSLLSRCANLRLNKLEYSLLLTYPKEAQLSVTEEFTKFILNKSKALMHSSQPFVYDKHISMQLRTEEDREQGHAWDIKHNSSSDPHLDTDSLLFTSDHQTYLNRDVTGEMNSDPQKKPPESISDFRGMEGEDDSSEPKELLALNSDEVRDRMTENGSYLGQAKAFQEGMTSEKEGLTQPRDLVRLETGGTEMVVSKVKKALPDKFHLLKNKTKGGLHDETGDHRPSIHPWDGGPLSLPTGLNNAQQNYGGQKALSEHSDFISKLSLGSQTNQAREEIAAKSQLRHPSVGQEALEKMSRNCDQCRKADTGTATAQCGHSFCRSCFSISEDTCIACLRSPPVNSEHVIKGTMTYRILSQSLAGYYRDPTIIVIYNIPNGVQGSGDPNPGRSYKGGRFEAFLPDNKEGRKLLPLLGRALDQGLTFKIHPHHSGDQLTWNILHKTSQQGGKLKNGYPDAHYFGNVFQQLKEHGIE
ncbi:uncharacterized protein LOC115074610 isoform X2 [Rhinatrema bivittatum]|nr:uncharacterized protein LOC115074610 isoform X2 [Rhinatrema bivittatum]XP_029430054.1 uncharacterized protein LOC115074610 isoform X2 [Rhinatrema bivittatum]XP_029430055.1 uncharacterized protein LOC115074610 isoform X2 [Rhinatrema bivittatum]